MKKLMLGNEAFARGLFESGCKVVSSYPGTPSTEITEAVAKYNEVYAEWAPNEKVAMEVAIGASIAGARAMASMKLVGVNVASDPLYSISYAGVNGGPAGDLFVTVAIRPHPIFTRNGSDVHVDIPISFAQAALGDTLQVPTIDGRIEYKIPEGTQTGTTFRMRGKGIQNVNGRGRGDQYVRVNIEVPKNLSDKQKKLLREFEETSTDENQVKRKSFWDKVKDALKDK